MNLDCSLCEGCDNKKEENNPKQSHKKIKLLISLSLSLSLLLFPNWWARVVMVLYLFSFS